MKQRIIIYLLLIFFIIYTVYYMFYKWSTAGQYKNDELFFKKWIHIVVTDKISDTEEINYQKIISQYYEFIFSWKLNKAYSLKYQPEISFIEFKKQYTFPNKHEYIIENILEKEGIFEVSLLIIDWKDDSITKYVIDFEFNGIHLSTKYVNTIHHEILDSFQTPWWLVTVEWESWIKKLYIDTNGDKKLILSKKIFFDTYNERYDYISYRYTYNNFELKENSTVLKFDAHEWEQAIFYEYNLLNNTLSEPLWNYNDTN